MTLFQVGVGSGGIVVLDHLSRETLFDRFILVDPDTYEARNVVRHQFPPSGVGRLKVELAAEWLGEFRPDARVETLAVDLTDPAHQSRINEMVAGCDIAVCAADNESAKYHFDALMRQNRKPWTLGEVLSGGIGGWAHRFAPDGACYGCVASHLKRERSDDAPQDAADYADPAGGRRETAIPATRNAICMIAGLHARVTMNLAGGQEADFSSVLMSLNRVDGVFSAAFQMFKFQIARLPGCLVCGADRDDGLSGEQLDVALDQALARLAHG